MAILTRTLQSVLNKASKNFRVILVNQNEIDIVLEQDGTLYPIEIKKTANPSASDCKSFRELEKLKKKVGLGAIICLQDERLALSRNVVSIPVWEIFKQESS